MGFREALEELNSLIEKGIIQDYAIGGGYAVIYYDSPFYTYDLDVFVVLDDEDNYHTLYEHYRERGNKIEGVCIHIADMPVQFFPNYISPLLNNAIEKAHKVEIEGIPSKVVKIEHLIALLLDAYRPKDKIRVTRLIEKANKKLLNKILTEFDDEQGKLHERFKQVLGNT
jgi:predicted nucleotidyltransferase